MFGRMGARGGFGSGALLGGVNFRPLQAATLARIKTAAAAALISNPVDNADMASPPTITTSSTHDATFSVQANHLANPGSFRVSSGNIYDRTTTNELFVGTSNISPATNGNLSFFSSLSPALVNNGEECNCYDITFVTSAQIVEINVRTALATLPYRFIVNGQYVARAGTTFVSNGFAKLDFGSSAQRTITVEVNESTAFKGVSVLPGGTITAPTDVVIKAASTGDSITEGMSQGASETYFHVWDAWSSVFSRQIGINSLSNTAVGGTGYVNTGGTHLNISGQMDYWINRDKYDAIIFFGGYNDDNQATVGAVATAAWRKARSAQPQALILVFGVPGESTGPNATKLATEAALAAAFTAWNDPCSLYIPVSNDPGGAWITGTGFVGSTNGSGNSDIYVSSDATHPSLAGHKYIGGKANTAVRTKLPALYTAFGVS